MKTTLFISVLCVLAVASADMSRIADILTAESNDLNNCDLIKQNSQISLGHKIAQVVCEQQTSELNMRFISFVKYVLFGIICSISTYLVFANDSKTVEYTRTDFVDSEGEETVNTPQGPVVEKQESECVEPEVKEITFEAVELAQFNLLPELPKLLELEELDLSLEEKSLDTKSNKSGPAENEIEDENVKQEEGDLHEMAPKCTLSEYAPSFTPVLNLGHEELLDFEAYKANIERQHTPFFRPRSFSDPQGCERYVQYPYAMGDAMNRIGENPEMYTAQNLNSLPSKLVHEERLDEIHEPGSPVRNKLDLIEDLMNVEGPSKLQQIPPEQKINERKPMVFVGGVSASTTPLELVTELKKQGFNVTVLPRIRYGVSFGFCPDLVLSSQTEVENLLSMGRVWVKDRWVDIRPYIPKEEPQAPSAQSSTRGASAETPSVRSYTPPQTQPTQMIHGVVENNVEYISHEELMSSCPTSPAPSQNATPSIGNASPVTPGGAQHHFVPHMNPPFIQMTPVLPFSPGGYQPHMVQPHFFPPPQEHFHVFSPTPINAMHSPSPPEQHPMQMFDENLGLSPTFQPMDSCDRLQHPAGNGGANQVFKIVSN